MATRTVDVQAKTPSGPSEPSEDYAKAKAAARARIVTILDRGITNERLNVDIPADVYGEWVLNIPTEVQRFQSMGFEIDDKFSAGKAVHGNAKIGDTVFMTCPRYVKEVIDEVRMERFIAMHGKPGSANRKLKEETDFASKSELPTVNTSTSEQIGIDEIRKALGSTG